METKMTIDDLIERLEKARGTLNAMKEAASKDQFGIHEEMRLAGKLDGVTLALSYVKDYKKFNDGN
jgi:hypothetical protein